MLSLLALSAAILGARARVTAGVLRVERDLD